ncbi:hypothetical protein BKA83DRAFT_4187948 [Pisolithus microcarpus]|nr:hypothetical protein BKA83DRAFT_4187948 [Pisolithus microcarpus]
MLLLPGFVFFFFCAHDRPSLILSLPRLLIFLASLLRSSCLKRNRKCPASVHYYIFTTHPIHRYPVVALHCCPHLSILSCIPLCHLICIKRPSIHFQIPRALFLFFFFFHHSGLCLYGYPYTVTPVSFDIPVGFLRPAQSPS